MRAEFDHMHKEMGGLSRVVLGGRLGVGQTTLDVAVVHGLFSDCATGSGMLRAKPEE